MILEETAAGGCVGPKDDVDIVGKAEYLFFWAVLPFWSLAL